MINIQRYNPDRSSVWDTLVENARNPNFLFYRAFMDYHSDRFQDHSLLFYSNEKLLAALPANELDGSLYSHQGLTYGGLIIDKKVTFPRLRDCFLKLLQYCSDQGLKSISYKPAPYIYHLAPSQDDLYLLNQASAVLTQRDLSSTIDLTGSIQIQERRYRGFKKAKASGMEMIESNDFGSFWKILSDNLNDKYKTKPTHSISEIRLLKERFPKNIRLFSAHIETQMLGGVVIFENSAVAHAQYISANSDGKALGALDYLFFNLIEVYKTTHRYFDFGISTEKQGHYINAGLLEQKEGFGARSTVYDRYLIEVERALSRYKAII